MSKGEKRARKSLLSLGLELVEGVYSVTMRRDRNQVYAIEHAEVYKSTAADSCVIFGEPSVPGCPPADLARVQQHVTQLMPEPFRLPLPNERNGTYVAYATSLTEPIACGTTHGVVTGCSWCAWNRSGYYVACALVSRWDWYTLASRARPSSSGSRNAVAWWYR